ncbi:restriction endonuclease [Stieleria sp. TO1_6]|uniref:restriction endonuclease n=1 Tax=Stieleria tagensis TaxID=2956795 RepID=UPI0028C16707|nr:restriction endonuclease [Stieleria tagensis]MCO8124260.1 restriction endonuclease [Stieleria tagensis]
MPKRTNEFQKLIGLIFTQMSDTDGATITESAMVIDRDSNDEREIDWLLKRSVAGVDIAIALECRDHKRKGDVTWIDQLIGKYRSLPVDRIVAVASAGFTKSAIVKAAANRVDCKTLEEAEITDWPSEFLRIGVALLNRTDLCIQATICGRDILVSLIDLQTFPANLGLSATHTSGETAEVAVLLNSIYASHLKDIANEHYKTNLKRLFPSLSGCSCFIRLQFQSIEFSGWELSLNDGTRSSLMLENVSILSQFQYEKASLKHEFFAHRDAMVSRGALPEPTFGDGLSVTVVQVASNPGKMSVRFNSDSSN